MIKDRRKYRPGYLSEITRNLSFEEIIEKLPEKRKAVYQTIKNYKYPISNERISDILNVPLHYVTPRTGELRDMELIEVTGYGISSTGKKVALWVIKEKQLEIFGN